MQWNRHAPILVAPPVSGYPGTVLCEFVAGAQASFATHGVFRLVVESVTVSPRIQYFIIY